MTGKVYTLLFYKFVDIENPEKFAEKHLEFCKSLNLLGRILVGKEGINGSVTGEKKDIDKYKEAMKKDDRFSDVVFKEDVGMERPFTKMKVLVKDEIIAIKKKIDLSKKAPYITSEELKDLYEKGEDFVILDTRNDYEWKVGKFKNAKVMNIKTFREFPDVLEEMKDSLKGKKIITYCTGGIRCEKATAYMKENGFEDEEVYQLKDGIINYCKDFPDSFWEGTCFVFDKRLVENYNNKEKPITHCGICDKECDLYKNCRNADCDKLIIQCVDCQKKLDRCCSEDCFNKFKEKCMNKSILRQGRKSS